MQEEIRGNVDQGAETCHQKVVREDTASGSMFGTRSLPRRKSHVGVNVTPSCTEPWPRNRQPRWRKRPRHVDKDSARKTTAAWKTKLQRGQRGRVTARQRRLLEKLSQPSKKPGLENARVYVLPKATANTELGPRQVLVDKVALADLVVVDNLKHSELANGRGHVAGQDNLRRRRCK